MKEMSKRRGLLTLLVSFMLLAVTLIIPGSAAALYMPIIPPAVKDIDPMDVVAPKLDLPIIPPVIVELPKLDLPLFNGISIKAVPLYRCWSGKFHWYTTNKEERDSWLASGFSDEGITCYISPVPLPNTVPLYKCMLYNDMYYATSSAERDAVISKYGYSYIGIEGYAIAGNNTAAGDVNINRWYRPEPDHSDGWEWLAGEKFIAASDMERHHFYQVDPANIPGYNYEGVTFRAWSSAKVLQRIKITAPNGGEALKAGNLQPITWTSTLGGGEVSLCYATDGGAANSWTIIKEGLPNSGSYSWTVPNKTSSNGVVQARWTYYDNETNSTAYATDTSDSKFSMTGTNILIPGLNPNLSLIRIIPFAPTGLTVTPYLFTRLDLGWKDNSNNETGFTIERKAAGGVYAPIATVGANKTKYSDATAKFGTTYYYRVKANGTFDSGYSNEASGVLQKISLMPNINYQALIPAAPASLTAQAAAGDPKGVKLSWKASPSDIDGYIIERKSGAADWEMSSTIAGNKTSVTESGLKTNQSYSYRVVAYNLFLNSKPSNVVVYSPGTGSGGNTGGGQVNMEFVIGRGFYNVNGASIPMDVSPMVLENRTLLPVRFVTDAIGANIQWFEAEQKVLITQGSTAMELWIGRNQAKINGLNVPIDSGNAAVMPLVINGRTMMPLRFIAEQLGCQVEWIDALNQVNIRYQGNQLNPQPDPPSSGLNPQPEPPIPMLR